MPVYKHVHGVTETQWAEWREKWEKDRIRWAEMTNQMHKERDKREAKR